MVGGRPPNSREAKEAEMRPFLLFVAVSCSPLASMAGQQQLAEQPAPGARVRLRAPGVVAGRYTGTVLSRTPDTLVVGRSVATFVRVPVSALTSLEVSRGKSRSRGALRGAALCAPIFGAVLGLVADDPPGRSAVAGRVQVVAAGALMGGLGGAIAGAIMPSERWHRYDLPARTSLLLPVTPGPARAGVRIAVGR
jgi:hypothetical protein